MRGLFLISGFHDVRCVSGSGDSISETLSAPACCVYFYYPDNSCAGTQYTQKLWFPA